MTRTALVVGGTGPTGPHVVRGLRDRGFDVTIYHRGAHEPPDLPEVRHIHGDPHFREEIEKDLGKEAYDVVVASYGRIKHLAAVLADRTQQFITIGGPPRYAGFYDPSQRRPWGLPLPVSETADTVREAAPDAPAAVRFAAEIAKTERAVFAAVPDATYFIYPFVYGPRNILPLEWSIIRRVLDGRKRMILPDEGLAILTRGAAQNLADFLLLAVDHPEAAAGQVFNCGDDVQYTLRQWVQLIIDVMGGEVGLVGVPTAVAPLFTAIYLPNPKHLCHTMLLDTRKARERLGYADVIHPVDAVRQSVEWYLENPIENEALPPTFVDRFNYALEDSVIDAWQSACAEMARQVPEAAPPDEAHPMPHPKRPNELVDERGR